MRVHGPILRGIYWRYKAYTSIIHRDQVRDPNSEEGYVGFGQYVAGPHLNLKILEGIMSLLQNYLNCVSMKVRYFEEHCKANIPNGEE